LKLVANPIRRLFPYLNYFFTCNPHTWLLNGPTIIIGY
jgi:hypothetical protein